MCLTKVKVVRTLRRNKTVYKAVRVSAGGQITTAVHGYPLKLGLNTDLRTEPLSARYDTKYPAGFHFYTKRLPCHTWTGTHIAVCRIPAGTIITEGEEVVWLHSIKFYPVIVTPTFNLLKLEELKGANPNKERK